MEIVLSPDAETTATALSALVETQPSANTLFSIGLTPLTEIGLGETYKGEDGGLYGQYSNVPPRDHLAAALQQAAKIQPLDPLGRVSASGEIVMISIGMSNTSLKSEGFARRIDENASVNPQLTFVNGAQGSRDAPRWAATDEPWDVLQQRLADAGISNEQVQVVWMEQADARPADVGEFPTHAEVLAADMTTILNRTQAMFPNLKIAYLSSRTFAGYATTSLNPEPFAYESAFAVRSMIREQIAGNPQLNWNSDLGLVNSPLLLWGPYFWADGEIPREDGLTWEVHDFRSDGTHPSTQGVAKVNDLMMEFFMNDPTTVPWFAGIVSTDPAGPHVIETKLSTDRAGDTIQWLAIGLSDAVDPSTVSQPGVIQLVSSGSDGVLGTGDDQIQQTELTLIHHQDRSRIKITPDSELALDQDYQLIVSDALTDVNGNQLDGDADGHAGGRFVWNITGHPGPSGTETGPQVIETKLSTDRAGDTIQWLAIGLSDAVDPSTVSQPGVIQLVSSGSDGVLGTADDQNHQIQLSLIDFHDRSRIKFNPVENLTLNQDYQLIVSDALTDVNGSPLDGDADGHAGGVFVWTIGGDS